MQYEEAAKLTPLLYLENVFTLLADSYLFHYHFTMTDYIGILIVFACLAATAVIHH